MVRHGGILRLRAMGVSQLKTALSCGCAPSTVQEAGKRARAVGAGWLLPEEMGIKGHRTLEMAGNRLFVE